MQGKPILCLDFDGVIHSYVTSWIDARTIPDAPVSGAMAFILRAQRTFLVAIFSSRTKQPGGLAAMRAYLRKHLLREIGQPLGLEAFDALQWPEEKPPALLTIDDRALTFNGDWASYDPEELLRFKPWNKR